MATSIITPRRTPITSSHVANAVNNLKTDWSGYTTGFSTHQVLSNTGPVYMALVFKYNANYGCAILMTYAAETDGSAMFFIQCANNVWGDPISLM